MYTYTVTEGNYSNDYLTAAINNGIENFISTLTREKIIDDNMKEKMDKYRIVVYKKGFWGKLKSKLYNEKEEELYMKIVRLT